MSNLLGSRAVDKTGLAGKYVFTLDWVPDRAVALELLDSQDLPLPRGIATAVA